MPLYLLIGSRYKFCFLKKMSLVWTKNIYFISKCFFKDRFIFVIQQFFLKKGLVPMKRPHVPPLSSWSTIKVRMTFCSLDPAAEGERSRGGKSEIFPPPFSSNGFPSSFFSSNKFLVTTKLSGLGCQSASWPAARGKGWGIYKISDSGL